MESVKCKHHKYQENAIFKNQFPDAINTQFWFIESKDLVQFSLKYSTIFIDL